MGLDLAASKRTLEALEVRGDHLGALELASEMLAQDLPPGQRRWVRSLFLRVAAELVRRPSFLLLHPDALERVKRALEAAGFCNTELGSGMSPLLRQIDLLSGIKALNERAIDQAQVLLAKAASGGEDGSTAVSGDDWLSALVVLRQRGYPILDSLCTRYERRFPGSGFGPVYTPVLEALRTETRAFELLRPGQVGVILTIPAVGLGEDFGKVARLSVVTRSADTTSIGYAPALASRVGDLPPALARQLEGVSAQALNVAGDLLGFTNCFTATWDVDLPEEQIAGSSLGLGLLLGILSSRLDKTLPTGLVVTGALEQAGGIIGVGKMEAKARAALWQGARTLLYPMENARSGDVPASTLVALDAAGVLALPVATVLDVCQQVGLEIPQHGRSSNVEPPLVQGLRFASVAHRFRGRASEMEKLRAFTLDPNAKMVCVVGRAGIGATSLVAKLCSDLEDPGKTGSVDEANHRPDGIVYITCDTRDRLTVRRLLTDTAQVVRPPECQSVLSLLNNDQYSPLETARLVLSKLPSNPILVALDNFEELLGEDRKVTDPELEEFFQLVLTTPNPLTIVATTQYAPIFPNVAIRRGLRILTITEGLSVEDSMAMLREFDVQGDLGLRSAPESILREAAIRSFGLPRAFEMIVGCLAGDESLTLEQLLESEALFDEQIIEKLFAHHHRQLSEPQRRVLDALSVYNVPMPVPAIETVLRPFFPEIAIEQCLRELARRNLVTVARGDGVTYDLHRVERLYVYSHIPNLGAHYSRQNLHRQQVRYLSESAAALQWKTRGRTLGLRLAAEYARQAKAIADGIDDNFSKGWAYVLDGIRLNRLQHFAAAVARVREAFEFASAANDAPTMAHALCLRASIEWAGNEEYGDISLIERALGLVSDGRDVRAELGVWDCMGTLGLRLQQWELVDRADVEQQRLATALSDHTLIADGLQRRGESLALRGEWESAASCLERSAVAFQSQSRDAGLCAARGWLGLSYCRLGRFDEGLALVVESLRTERDLLDSKEGVAKWLLHLGELFLERHEPERAAQALLISRDLYGETEHVHEGIAASRLCSVRDALVAEAFDTLESSFDARASEFGGYGFAWGLGPFQKHPRNPILAAQGDGWESSHLFNPAAWFDGELIYMLYRAEGPQPHTAGETVSSIGLASSADGVHFKRYAKAILYPTEKYELPGGCEDPRIVRIDGRFILTYTAYDGRVARLAMAVSDDLQNWEKWGPVFRDEDWERNFPNEAHRAHCPRGWTKSGAILPQKIGDLYWMYFGDKFLWAASSRDLRHWQVHPTPVMLPRQRRFDSRLVEPGPPPILLSEGIWLGYNAANEELRYSFGQALFSRDDPTTLIRRSPRPLLEPTNAGELVGQVNQVVFGEGLVAFRNQWHLYYGMADSRIGLASAPIASEHRSVASKMS